MGRRAEWWRCLQWRLQSSVAAALTIMREMLGKAMEGEAMTEAEGTSCQQRRREAKQEEGRNVSSHRNEGCQAEAAAEDKDDSQGWSIWRDAR